MAQAADVESIILKDNHVAQNNVSEYSYANHRLQTIITAITYYTPVRDELRVDCVTPLYCTTFSNKV